MITREEITAAGVFTKTHGLKGELHALLDVDAELLEQDPLFIVDVDGIYVPFYAESVRAKGQHATLIKPDGVETEQEAKLFVGKKLYIKKEALLAYERQDAAGDEGAYADDFVGYRLLDENGENLGEITRLETSTANTLFVVRTPLDKTLYVPAVDDFVTAVDTEAQTITMQLPQGLVDLND